MYTSRWGRLLLSSSHRLLRRCSKRSPVFVCVCVCLCVCLYLCSFVGAKYSSMGLLTFQYFSLTSSREKDPFST